MSYLNHKYVSCDLKEHQSISVSGLLHKEEISSSSEAGNGTQCVISFNMSTVCIA